MDLQQVRGVVEILVSIDTENNFPNRMRGLGGQRPGAPADRSVNRLQPGSYQIMIGVSERDYTSQGRAGRRIEIKTAEAPDKPRVRPTQPRHHHR